MSDLHERVVECLKNRKIFSGFTIIRLLQEEKNHLAQLLCSRATCDKCKLARSKGCLLDKVFDSIDEIIEELREDAMKERAKDIVYYLDSAVQDAEVLRNIHNENTLVGVWPKEVVAELQSNLNTIAKALYGE